MFEKESQKEGFWNDHEAAGKLTKEAELFKREISDWEKIKKDSAELLEFSESIEEADGDEISLARDQYGSIGKEFGSFEKLKLFSGPYDRSDAIVSIHAGAGGDDAQDWAEMLLRMYLRYCERKNFHAKILSESRGSEAGIKSVDFEVAGSFAFGIFRAEAGVHRLVRLSPFNSDNLRQTSFALVEATPLIEQSESIELAPSELRVDTYRSSGAGGQSVNTTDSAVRVTHLPSGIVVTCQNERSQLQNKEKALAILRSKLTKLEAEKALDEAKKLKGDHKSAEWGNQIRSYVLHPYKMVKDHRTGIQTSDTEKVLGGDLDEFVEGFLRENKNANKLTS